MQYDFRPTRTDHAGIIIPLFLAMIAAVALFSSSIHILSWRMPLRIIGLASLFFAPLLLFRYRLLYYSYKLTSEKGSAMLYVYSHVFGHSKLAFQISLCDVIAIDAYPHNAKERRKLRKERKRSLTERLSSADYRVNLFAQSSFLLTIKGNAPQLCLLEIDEPFADLIRRQL